MLQHVVVSSNLSSVYIVRVIEQTLYILRRTVAGLTHHFSKQLLQARHMCHPSMRRMILSLRSEPFHQLNEIGQIDVNL